MSRNTIAALAAALALLAVVSADFDSDMRIIFPEEASEPVGIEATRRAIESTVTEMAKAHEGDMHDPMFVLFFQRLRDYHDVCVPDKTQCEHNLELLKRLVEIEEYNSINLYPYLKRCQEEQEAFCASA